MPRPFSEKEKRIIRQRLLEQGYRLFSAHGLRKTSIEEIAGAAGISKGAFYLFYESKEALFLDAAQSAEKRLRQGILAAIELPGPSPRARLLAVLSKAFEILKTAPILRFVTGADFDLLLSRVPDATLRDHLFGDLKFFEELISRCQNAGIPIRAKPEQIMSLLFPLVFVAGHEENLGGKDAGGGTEGLLELVAAFSLGEIQVQFREQLQIGTDRAAEVPG